MDTPQPDQDGIIIINGRRYRIENDGSVTSLDGNDMSGPRTATEKEQSDLDYLINNHPDRLNDVNAARDRRDALNKELGFDNNPTAVADKRKQFRNGKLKAQMRAKMVDMAQDKQND